jgi:hypothetical protein
MCLSWVCSELYVPEATIHFLVIMLDLETLSCGLLACFGFILQPSMFLCCQLLLSHAGPQGDVVRTDFA